MITSHVFDTFIGPVGVALDDEAIVAVQLPAGSAGSPRSAQATAHALAQKLGAAAGVVSPIRGALCNTYSAARGALCNTYSAAPGALCNTYSAPGALCKQVPRRARPWVRALTRHLRGEVQDLAALPVRFDFATPFAARIYRELGKIPAGATITYQGLATKAGQPGAVCAVGQAMRHNPCPLIVPCHRVLASGGRLGGFTAADGTTLKQTLLQIEKAQFVSHDWLDWSPPEAMRELSLGDARLARLIARVGPFNLVASRSRSPYEALFRAIVFQQLNGRAASCILERVLGLFGGFPAPRQFLAVSAARLRAQGLSQAKLLALRDLARHRAEGAVPERFSAFDGAGDDEIVAQLSLIRGIGEWTVQMMLIFAMGRPDVFPVNDFAIRKAFTTVFKRELAPREMLRFAERWAPYRSLVAWYLWRSLDVP